MSQRIRFLPCRLTLIGMHMLLSKFTRLLLYTLFVTLCIQTGCIAQLAPATKATPTPLPDQLSQPTPTTNTYLGAPIHIARSQDTFAAGSPSNLLVQRSQIIVLNSWSRGDSILVLGTPEFGAFFTGLPVMGYMFQGTIQGDYIYIANWFSLVVVDNASRCFGKPFIARQMLFHFPSGNFNTIASTPAHLYLGDRSQGLRVLDISVPGSPILTAYLPEIGGIRAIAASPSRIIIQPIKGETYIAIPSEDETRGIEIKARLPLKGTLTLIDQTLYESTGKAINIYDLSNPAAPQLLNTLAYERVIAEPFKKQILFAKDKTTLVVMDVASPQDPKVIREITLKTPLPAGQYVFEGERFYVLDKSHALVQKFAFPQVALQNVTPKLQIPLMRNAGTLEIIGSHQPANNLTAGLACYLKAYVQGDQITLLFTVVHKKYGKVSSDQFIQQTMTKHSGFRHYSQQWAAAMVRLGQYVLLGDGVVDVTNPQKPKIIVPTTRPAASIFLDQQRAYLAQGDRMTILDLTTMPKPVTLGQYMPNVSKASKQTIVDVNAQGHFAHVLSTNKTGSILEVLDVTSPADPNKVAELSLPMSIAMTRHGNYLYIPSINPSNASPVLNIVDLTKPDQPKLVATIEHLLRGDCYRLKVDQNTLYIADDNAGILALDLSNPIKPVLTAVYRGTDDSLQVYTDFIIEDRKLHALRYSQIDEWPLTSQTSQTNQPGQPGQEE